MRNRIFKYFFVSLLLIIGGLIYFAMVYDNQIIIKERSVVEQGEKKSSQEGKTKPEKISEPKSGATGPATDGKADSPADRKPAREEQNKPSSPPKSDHEDRVKSGKININHADKAELMKLKGIGEKKAERILEYRKQQGDFKRIEDIMKIKGIKRKAFEKIKDDITVSE